MWTRQVMGVETYYIIQSFIIYSMMGWLVESIYMSICNGKLTNRGFVRGPFCPIYGIGALSVYFILRPWADNYLVLYIFGAALATTFEYLVARLTLRLFGQVWWDYNDKPFNYQGILCLESTVAWGFYTLFMFVFLQRFVEWTINRYSMSMGILLGRAVLAIFTVDLFTTIYKIRRPK